MEQTRPLQNSLWLKHKAYGLPLALLGTLFLAIASHITIPLEPVPFTLQTLAVLFIGMTLGARLATLTIVCYLLEGFAGLPVFQSPITTGATLGYLWGFLPAAYITGYLADKGFAERHLNIILIGMLGTIMIWLCGTSVLKALLHLSWLEAIELGIKPFILGDGLKVIFLACIVPGFRRLAR